MNKRGQFYIIAAIIIVSIVLASVGIRNYAFSKKQQSQVYDLGKELNIETGNVLDYGMVQQEDLPELIKNWSNNYYQYATKKTYETNETYLFIYINPKTKNLTIITFNTLNIGEINIGGTSIEINGEVMNTTVIEEVWNKKEINITFGDITYTFKIKPGYNIWFLISTKEAIVTSERIPRERRKEKIPERRRKK